MCPQQMKEGPYTHDSRREPDLLPRDLARLLFENVRTRRRTTMKLTSKTYVNMTGLGLLLSPPFFCSMPAGSSRFSTLMRTTGEGGGGGGGGTLNLHKHGLVRTYRHRGGTSPTVRRGESDSDVESDLFLR